MSSRKINFLKLTFTVIQQTTIQSRKQVGIKLRLETGPTTLCFDTVTEGSGFEGTSGEHVVQLS